eukprot:15497203-Heterocapsa_arctica.AAC.1
MAVTRTSRPSSLPAVDSSFSASVSFPPSGPPGVALHNPLSPIRPPLPRDHVNIHAGVVCREAGDDGLRAA